MWKMRLATLLCFIPVVASYNMMHAIDPMMVVCDPIPVPANLPAGMTADQWPTEQEFDVFFEYNYDIDEAKPHIVSFVRASQKGVSIEYELRDALNHIVVPKKTVTLAAEANLIATDPRCACTGVNTGINTAIYGANYGTSCSNWDQDNCATWFPDVTMGDWCCKQWCYVSSSCSDAYVSEITNGYFSYDGACGGTSVSTGITCPVPPPPGPCACVDVQGSPPWTADNTTKFHVGYGATCKDWDYGWCDAMYPPNVIDSWCCMGWCWVGSECPSKIPSEVWPGIYYTLAECSDNATRVSTCPYRPLPAAPPTAPPGAPTPAPGTPTPPPTADPNCACIGQTPGVLTSGRRRAGGATFPSNYGQTCSAWDQVKCDDYFPLVTTAIWCCQSWCYVDELCPTARASMILPGFFYSYEACPDSSTILSGCAFGDDCRALTTNHDDPPGTGLTNAQRTTYGQNYGVGCAAHDMSNCADWFSSEGFWDSTHQTVGWCCDKWAYVRCSCPLSIQGSLQETLCYSYALCDNPSTQYYDCNNTCVDTQPAACARRLDDTVEQGDEKDNQEQDGDISRRLSGRRRTGSSSGRSYSSPRRRTASGGASFSGARRRAPPAARPSYSARRRAPSAPAPQPRRRATPPTRRREPPRRREPLRRRTPPAPPALPRRRTTPVNQAPTLPATDPRRRTGERRRVATTGPGVDSSARRRTTGVGGQSYSLDSTSPRRRTVVGETRRRTSGYGYQSSGALQQNYGGTMPAKTNYGYSGAGPKKDSKVPMMMAAAGGVAVGAVAGVGAYYMYQRYQEDNWGSSNTRDQSWCTAPDGRMMRCSDCYQKYRTCTDENQCFSGSCSYQMHHDTRQDDDMQSGFIPMEYQAPLKLRITSIQGDDFAKADICPRTQPCEVPTPTPCTFDDAWQRASSFDVNLFVTLRQLDSFPAPPTPGLDAGTASDAKQVVTYGAPLFVIMALFVFMRARI